MATPKRRTEAGTAAARLLAGKADLVDAAGRAAEAIGDARQRLVEAEKEYADAFQAALDGGWTAAELGQVGLVAPAGRRGRSGHRRAASTPSDSAPAGPASVSSLDAVPADDGRPSRSSGR